MGCSLFGPRGYESRPGERRNDAATNQTSSPHRAATASHPTTSALPATGLADVEELGFAGALFLLIGGLLVWLGAARDSLMAADERHRR